MKQEHIDMLEEACSKSCEGCALERLAAAGGQKFSRLSETATALGLTEAEAYGVMDGWDLEMGFEPIFEDECPWDPAYHVAKQVGQNLAKKYGRP